MWRAVVCRALSRSAVSTRAAARVMLRRLWRSMWTRWFARPHRLLPNGRLLPVRPLLRSRLRAGLRARPVRLFTVRLAALGLHGPSPSAGIRDGQRLPLCDAPHATAARGRLRQRLLLRHLRPARAELLLLRQFGRPALQLQPGPAGGSNGLSVLHGPRPARFPARQPATLGAVLSEEHGAGGTERGGSPHRSLRTRA